MKGWKEAATLIIAARTKTPVINYLGDKKFSLDYQILMLQRTAKAGAFASAQVFPGGTIDPADLSPDWLDVFKKYGNVHSTADFGKMVNIQGSRPPMTLRDHHSPLPMDVAFRICAIRETFEESGILLLRETAEDGDGNDGVTLGRCLTLTEAELKYWRKEVHKDAGNFLSLCQKLRCFPDIWSLAEWANWLTPREKTRRFDTMFYITFLESRPDALEDKSEIVQSMWITPLQSLQMFARAETFLPGPQIYELRRLLRFENFDTLTEFSWKRAFEGAVRFLPVTYGLEDGWIHVFPGDEEYPINPKEESATDEIVRKDESSAASFSPEKITNRIIHRVDGEAIILHSSKPVCGHVAPFTDMILVKRGQGNAKL